jgi:hypothetical protein
MIILKRRGAEGKKKGGGRKAEGGGKKIQKHKILAIHHCMKFSIA